MAEAVASEDQPEPPPRDDVDGSTVGHEQLEGQEPEETP